MFRVEGSWNKRPRKALDYTTPIRYWPEHTSQSCCSPRLTSWKLCGQISRPFDSLYCSQLLFVASEETPGQAIRMKNFVNLHFKPSSSALPQPPSSSSLVPLDLTQRLRAGSDKIQKKAAKELAVVLANYTTPENDAAQTKSNVRTYTNLFLSMSPPQRSILASQVQRIFGPSVEKSPMQPDEKRKLKSFISCFNSIREDAAKERFVSAVESPNFPNNAAYKAFWTVREACTHEGAENPELWGRYTTVLFEHLHLFGGDQETWVDDDSTAHKVTPEVCRTLEVLNAFHPNMPDSTEGHSQARKDCCSSIYRAMQTSTSRGQSSSEPVLQYGMDILKALAVHQKMTSTYDAYHDLTMDANWVLAAYVGRTWEDMLSHPLVKIT